MIREASVYTLKKQAPEARACYGYRVLVMRYWPRGISWQDVDAWLPTPTFLLTWRRGGMSWNDFKHIIGSLIGKALGRKRLQRY